MGDNMEKVMIKIRKHLTERMPISPELSRLNDEAILEILLNLCIKEEKDKEELQKEINNLYEDMAGEDI